jgi:hypothetical protein
MNRNEIKKKIIKCLKKFDSIDSPDDMVSVTMFNIYRQEMNEICRLFESEFRKLKHGDVCNHEWITYITEDDIEMCKKCIALRFNYNK